ncbi:MAG: hypothetical protein ABI949_01065 [Ilumatobacteraceae bacterium]
MGGCVALAVVAGCGGTTYKSSSNAITPVTTVIGDVGGQASAASGDDTDTGAAACKLLSEDEVSAAMKQPMKIAGGAGSAVCEYAATADPSVLLAVQIFATRQDASVYSSPETSSEHIDGLGDDAFWNSALDMVFVRKGERSIAVTSPSLSNLTGDPQASKTAMVALAKLVMAKF